MYNFKLQTDIMSVSAFSEFAETERLAQDDLIITNEFIYNPFIKPIDPECKVLFQEKYGSGEPNDEMIDAIRKDIPGGIKRIIAIGGGTVIDIAKVLIFEGSWKTEEIFMGKLIPEKVRSLIVIPTTCGTGSEVTNITISELKSQKTKKGLALNSMYPDKAVLIPEMVKTLPYKFFATSSIDALIHAVESFLSPKAIAHSEAYAQKAIELIINGYLYLKEYGTERWTDQAEDFLTASNLAGIAFGYAGCAAVHALSYPLGGMYHIPHGEANQLMFAAVMSKYKEKQPVGKINQLEELFAGVLKVDPSEALSTLYELMEFVLHRKNLHEYGISEAELSVFSEGVLAGQQRLLNNNYVPLGKGDMMAIYQACY